MLYAFEPVDLGNAIRVNREKRGLKQGELADKLGISQAFLSNIEKGKNTPSLEMLFKIRIALNAQISDFFPTEHPLSWLPSEVVYGLSYVGPALDKEEQEALAIILTRFFDSVKNEKNKYKERHARLFED